MNHKKSLGQPLAGFRSLPSALLIVVVLSTILFSLQGSAYAQSQEVKNYTITLKSRTFTPQPGIKRLLKDSLIIHLERGEKRHVYLQLQKHLKAEERVSLEKQGIKLLSYIGSYTWHATISHRQVLKFVLPDAILRTPILGTIRWIGDIQPDDKIEPKIRREGVGAYNRQPDGRVDVVVVFFPDVLRDPIDAVVKQYGEMLQPVGMLNDIIIRLREPDIQRLVGEDVVQWIEEVGPPEESLNDGSRAATNVEPVQIAPYDLDGTNVQVGEWDTGEIDDTHDDLAGRVTVVEAVGVDGHATHVAGTLGGDGSRSTAEGGTPNQWRGMASWVDFFSYTYVDDDLEPEEHDDAINTHGIDLSQNSWGRTGSFGEYRARSAKYDNIARGIYDRPIPLVFAAGNSGPGFDTILAPGATAKNTITVGNVYSDTLGLRGSSSRGPTDNDQTKPDVVAPGCEVGGDGGITSTEPGDIYGVRWGTSMAAPVVSGTIALMLQQYRETYFGSAARDEAPLPSTFKAVLIHTAEDLIDHPDGGADLVGPDYMYGYGLISAQAAVDAIRNQRFREGVILSEDDEDIYTFEVTAGEDELGVTLAWDDVPGTAGAADILQNDLDLLLINPDGDEFYPPWELDPTNPATPAVRNSYATEALADGHRDDVNVVEQVIVDNPEAGTWIVKVKVKAGELPYPYQRYSIIAGDQAGDQLEGKIDIMQVLDRSGSMGGYASDTSTDRKIEVLKFAADQFIQMMKPDLGNQLGLVQFNQDVVPFDAIHEADLAELTTVRAALLRGTTVPFIEHGGSTSIGDGLQEALNQLTSALADPDHDHVIFLVSDGKENTRSWIADVQDDLIEHNIVVYPLGLGYGSGIDEAKLTDLAEATGGTYRITSDDLIFRKFFIEVLAGAVDWDVLVDPIGELTPGETVTIPVTITADQLGATFTAYWDGIDNAVQLELITPSPSGLTITPATLNDKIRYGSHPRYAFYQLDFPLSGTLAKELAGEWKMKLAGVSDLQQNVRYSASAFGEGGAELDVAFDRLSHLTGDTVLMTARLNKKGVPLTGASIEVDCDVPVVGAGNVLHQGKVSRNELEKNRIIFGDTISLIDRKLEVLSKRAGADVLKRGVSTLALYDDGRHGDGKANDGVYANRLKGTKIAGTYTCRFVASGIPAAGGQTTTREWTKSFYNEVNINPDYSIVDVKLIRRVIDGDLDGWKYGVNVAPRDKFGNYLGPGHPVLVTLAYTNGSRQVELDDNIDGTYTKDIYISQWELGRDAKLMIEIDGKTFATVEKLPTYNKWSVSLHSGTAIPTGSFANDFDPGLNVLLDIDYHFSPQLSLVGVFGYNDFKSKTTGVDDNYWINLSANMRYHQPLRGLFSYYIGAGPGVYIPETGDTEFGANLGAGVDYNYNSSITFEVGADYHTIFDPDIQFLHSHVGVIFRF